jgi:hypothetical protein
MMAKKAASKKKKLIVKVQFFELLISQLQQKIAKAI